MRTYFCTHMSLHVVFIQMSRHMSTSISAHMSTYMSIHMPMHKMFTGVTYSCIKQSSNKIKGTHRYVHKLDDRDEGSGRQSTVPS